MPKKETLNRAKSAPKLIKVVSPKRPATNHRHISLGEKKVIINAKNPKIKISPPVPLGEIEKDLIGEKRVPLPILANKSKTKKLAGPQARK